MDVMNCREDIRFVTLIELCVTPHTMVLFLGIVFDSFIIN